MHIKPGKNEYFEIARLCLWTVACCAVLLWSGVTWGICVFVLAVMVYVGLLYAVAICREIEMDQTGCRVRFLFVSRYYTWEQLITRTHEIYRTPSYQFPYDGSVFFSTHRLHKPQCLKPEYYVFITRPGSFFFVHFATSQKKYIENKWQSEPLICCVDKEKFMGKMAEWNISLEEYKI